MPIPGIDSAGIISGFDAARRQYRDAEMKNAHAQEDRQYAILQALATHMDPEIAAIGASGLLEMAGGKGPQFAKNFGGFMGQIDQSAYMDPLKKYLGAGATNAAPQPGSAAQPDTALVEPEAQQAPSVGATPPTFGAPGMQPQGAQAPTFGAQAGPSVGGTTAPTFGGGPSPQAPALGSMAPAGPPPPETPQQRSRRLFPSAADIAEETTYRNLQARLRSVMEAIRGARTEDERDLVRGIAGAPRARTATKPMNAQFRTADGQELEGTVVFDPSTGQAEVDGQPVTILKMLPTNAPRPIRQPMNTGGTRTDMYLNPSTLEPIGTVDTGIPISGPPPYSGTVTTSEGVFRLPREGGQGEKIGDAPPRAGDMSADQQQATGMLADVNAAIKAALSQYNLNRPAGFKGTSLPVEQQNAIVKQVTKNRYKTIGELTAATKRTGGSSGGGETMRDRANRVRQRLESNQPSRVQGSGLPPGM